VRKADLSNEIVPSFAKEMPADPGAPSFAPGTRSEMAAYTWLWRVRANPSERSSPAVFVFGS